MQSYLFDRFGAMRTEIVMASIPLSFGAAAAVGLLRGFDASTMARAFGLAGSQSAGEEMLTTLRPFVYRKYFDFAALESIRDMKAMVSAEVIADHQHWRRFRTADELGYDPVERYMDAGIEAKPARMRQDRPERFWYEAAWDAKRSTSAKACCASAASPRARSERPRR